MKSYFIAGTDTSVGKTTVTAALLHAFSKVKLQTAALKPVATGCFLAEQALVSEDSIILQAAATVRKKNETFFYFEPPIAPSIAASLKGIALTSQAIAAYIHQYQQALAVDRFLVEGIGGLMVPLNESETMLDVVCVLKMPVVLVVGLKLGCLNHALLSREAIQNQKLDFAGWVGNNLGDEPQAVLDIIKTLKKCLPAPCLGVLPFEPSLSYPRLAEFLTLPS